MSVFVQRVGAVVLASLTAIVLAFAPPAAQAAAFKPGEVFRDCPDCPEMVVIPPGSFIMGTTAEEHRKYGAPALFDKMEGPRHPVTIGYSFAVGKFSVTMAQWDACVADGGCNGYRPDDAGWGRGRQPVINVDWADAQSYVDWIKHKTGKNYRLLSEAEWEYAARAGTTTTFFWGSTLSDANANYGGRRKQALEVGSYPPNNFGLYDMAGNTAQWVQDCYHDSYEGAPADGSAWTAGADCVSHNVRGGGWSLADWCMRVAQRVGDPPGNRNTHLGFRVARDLP